VEEMIDLRGAMELPRLLFESNDLPDTLDAVLLDEEEVAFLRDARCRLLLQSPPLLGSSRCVPPALDFDR
jgi:hypothetical protein